jgi:hypothetical protein
LGTQSNEEDQQSPMRTYQDPDNGITYVYCSACYVVESMDRFRRFLKHDVGCENEGH